MLKQQRFRSEKQNVFNKEINKIVLSPKDDEKIPEQVEIQ